MIGIKLGNVLLNVALYTNTATMDGTGGGSIAAWADADGYVYEDAMLVFTNNGAADVVVGDETEPVHFIADGNVIGLLFDGRSVTISAGGSLWWPAPKGATLAGTTWAISAALNSDSPVDVSVVARPVSCAIQNAGRALLADAVWDEALAGHFTAGSAGLALFVTKGLAQSNFILDNTVYDLAGMMTSGRIRIFPDAVTAAAATMGGVGQGEVAAFTVSATGAGGLATLYKVVQA